MTHLRVRATAGRARILRIRSDGKHRRKRRQRRFLQTVWNSLQKVTKARKEACIPRNANSNFVFLAAFCRSVHRCIHLMRRQTNSAPEVIGAAIEVHREKGPGLIESTYERCTLRELELR